MNPKEELKSQSPPQLRSRVNQATPAVSEDTSLVGPQNNQQPPRMLLGPPQGEGDAAQGSTALGLIPVQQAK